MKSASVRQLVAEHSVCKARIPITYCDITLEASVYETANHFDSPFRLLVLVKLTLSHVCDTVVRTRPSEVSSLSDVGLLDHCERGALQHNRSLVLFVPRTFSQTVTRTSTFLFFHIPFPHLDLLSTVLTTFSFDA